MEPTISPPIDPEKANTTEQRQQPGQQQLIEAAIPRMIRTVLEIKHQNNLNIVDQDGITIAESTLTAEKVLGEGDTSLILYGTTPDSTTVALKIFSSEKIMNKSKLERLFNDESLLLSVVDHPNIAKSYGIGIIRITENTSLPVIVREFIPHPLSEITGDDKKMSLEDALDLTRSIADALDYLYANHQVIMTDITPPNLYQKENGTWMISDLGHIAKSGTDNPVGVDGQYVAPEIMNEKDPAKQNNIASPQSEVYSLALVVWHSLTGKEIDSLAKALDPSQIITQEELPIAVFEVLQKATSEDPQNRFADPIIFAESLEAAIKNGN